MTELTTMSQLYIIEAGLRTIPGVPEQPSLKTLYWLMTLRWNSTGGHMSSLFKDGHLYQQWFETITNRPDVTEDVRLQMAEMFPSFATPPKTTPILEALSEAGLTRQFEAFRAAVALAATESADFTIVDNAFGSDEEFAEAITTYVERTPALAAWAAQVRIEMDDNERMDWLALNLSTSVEQAHAWLPKVLQTIHIIRCFEGEVSYGGIQSFFFNSSGDLAPEVAVELRALGLTAQAEIVEHGIAMFPTPYPRDTGLRREQHFREGGGEWDDQLAALGTDMDADAIGPTLIELARREGVLPK